MPAAVLSAAAAAATAATTDDARREKALRASSRPLIALATQLRRAVLDRPEDMKRALAAAVDRFERELAAAGWDERGIAVASYLLCTWVDEVVADTPWGAGGAGLLERFHGERPDRTRALRLLSRLAEQPRENHALLTLFHACLSLGLGGRPEDTPALAQQLEQLRGRVFLTLPAPARELSPPWQTAVAPAPPAWRRRLALGALLLLALAAFATYTISHLLLAARVDEVFASMQQLSAAGAALAPAPAPAPAAAPRLAPLLAEDAAAGRLAVRDDAHRSTVTIAAERLFDGDTTLVSADGAALLGRVAAALARHDGKLLVVGHTDGRDARSARLPSAWHQSFEWARGAAEVLGRTLPPGRLAVEGRADLPDPPDTAQPPARRVDIVLFP